MPLRKNLQAPASAASAEPPATTDPRPEAVPVLALLQNQWFKDPERIPKVLEAYSRHIPCPVRARARFVRDMLFFGCLTGKRIKQAFGEDLLDQMAFEEVSTQVGGAPSSVFAPEPLHVLRVLQTFAPRVVVLFGKVAASAVAGNVAAYVAKRGVGLVFTCHPAARGPDVISRLAEAAAEVRGLLSGGGA